MPGMTHNDPQGQLIYGLCPRDGDEVEMNRSLATDYLIL
jgi:hypothetical protein